MRFTLEYGRCLIECELISLGSDISLIVKGGTHHHIGSTAMAIPRQSLTGTGTSATVSVLNALGHKDDIIAVEAAKILASKTESIVVCTAGVHIDDASPEELCLLSTAGKDIAEKAFGLLQEMR